MIGFCIAAKEPSHDHCRASDASVVYLVTWHRFRLYAVYRRDTRAISTFLTAQQVRGYLR